MTEQPRTTLPDWPCLMRRALAAQYLDLTPEQFDRHVAAHVAPIDFGARGHRWARDALDRWVDNLTVGERPAENAIPQTAEQRRKQALERL